MRSVADDAVVSTCRCQVERLRAENEELQYLQVEREEECNLELLQVGITLIACHPIGLCGGYILMVCHPIGLCGGYILIA
jgi:hypothetical protein